MQIKLPFDSSQPVTGESSIIINESRSVVFSFIAENYFDNYCKWAPEVVELESFDNKKVFIGAKGRQVREDNDSLVESTFEVIDYTPNEKFVLQGFAPPYKSTYLTETLDKPTETKLTFKFDLLEIELFMRPFVKLIRAAIEEGAENTVEKIKELIVTQDVSQHRSSCAGD